MNRNTMKRWINNPWRIGKALAQRGVLNFLPDKAYLSILYRANIGRKIHWKNPVTFNEKLQWLKVYNRNPQHATMVDKYRVRDYVANTIGEEYLIPLLGVWKDAQSIDFDALPEKFVLKCNHNSGLGMCICTDKSALDLEIVKSGLTKGLQQNYYLTGREWCYKNVEPRIIAETFMQDKTGELRDYKFMCFNGKVKCSFVCSDRFSGDGLHVTFFDRNWNVMPFERHYPARKEGIEKPEKYEEMLELAEKLAQDHPFVRVDLYEVDGQIYFGELTLYPGSGFEEFTPEEWDEILGSWIDLSGIQHW